MTQLLALSMPVNLATGETDGINFTVVQEDGSSIARSVPSDHPNFAAVQELVSSWQAGDLTVEDLADKILETADLERVVRVKFETIPGLLDGRMAISEGVITVDGDPIDPALEGHLLRLLGESGKPKEDAHWKAFAAFVENLYTNSSEFVRTQLFGWLNYENLHGQGFTLTEDGCFLGYKGCAGSPDAPVSVNHGTAVVNGEKHTGAIPNPLGAVVTMPRSSVQDDPRVGCAAGLHVGTYNYAKGWARGVLLTVKVNPRDVVSVPTECNAQKIRTCRYEVLEVTEGPNNGLTYFGRSYAPEGETSEAYVEALREAIADDLEVTFEYHGKARNILPETLEQVHGGYRFTGLDEDDNYKTFKVSEMTDLAVEGETVEVEGTPEALDEDTSDVEALLEDARANGSQVEFDYNGKHRVVTVTDIYDGHSRLLEADENGQTKTFTIASMDDVKLVAAAPAPAPQVQASGNAVADLIRDAEAKGQAITFRYNGKVRTVKVTDVWCSYSTNEWTMKGKSLVDGGVRTFIIARMSDVELAVS